MDIIVPWRPAGCEHRQAAFDYIRQHMRGYTLLIADDNSEPFSRAGSKNLGASMSAQDVLFFLDADMLVPHEQIDAAIELARTAGLVVAFDRYIYINKEITKLVLTDNIELFNVPAQYTASFPVGGAVAVRRDLFPGYDTDFIGWGMEDVALVEALHWQGIELQRIAGPAVHLWHPGHMRDDNVINNERIYRQKYLGEQQ